MNNSIDVRALTGKLWAKKWGFVIAWVVTAVVTYAATFLMPIKWEASTEFTPEYNLMESKLFQEILYDYDTEVELPKTADVLLPVMYDGIMHDVVYMSVLAQQTVVDSEGKTMTIGEVYGKGSKGSSGSKGSKNKVYERMSKNITCAQTRKRTTVTIRATAADAEIAQQIANIAREQLADYIATYRADVIARNVEHYGKLATVNKLAAKMYEMAQIEAERHQPIFAVIRQASVPSRPKSPRRLMLTGVMLILMTLGMTCWCWREDIVEWL